jgi:hypothetical protein
VGTGIPAPDRVTDMELVGYFLTMIYLKGNRRMFPIKPKEEPTLPLPTLGESSPDSMKRRLRQWIPRFQNDMIRLGVPIFADGRVDTARGIVSSITKTRYTIHMLNGRYAEIVKARQGRSDWQNFLISDPVVAPSLKAELGAPVPAG